MQRAVNEPVSTDGNIGHPRRFGASPDPSAAINRPQPPALPYRPLPRTD